MRDSWEPSFPEKPRLPGVGACGPVQPSMYGEQARTRFRSGEFIYVF